VEAQADAVDGGIMPKQIRPLYKTNLDSSRLDWSVLDGLVRDITDRDVHLSKKFSIYVLRILLRLSEVDAFDALTDASQDRGVDAVVVDEASHNVHLFQFKYHESEDHLSKNFPGRSVDYIAAFVDDLLQKRKEIFKSTNKLLHPKINQIWDLVERGPAQLHIHFASNGRKLESEHRSRLQCALDKYAGKIWEYGANDLVKHLSRKRNFKDRRRLTFQNDARFELHVNEKRMLTGVVELSELARFLRHPTFETQIDHSLFNDNVRGVLGIDAAVNRQIARTISSEDASNFVFFNNGITIVADQVLYQTGGNFPVDMINPQIVNGCQTASMIFEALQLSNRRFDDHDLGPSVQVRIIESNDPKFTETVALATNSQTRIYGRDLRAIDETQLKIERALNRLGFSYLRKRSDKSDRPRSQTIDMARLGQNILAYYRRQPELAKTKSNDVFGEFYEAVFDKTFLNPDRIIAVHLLSNQIEERREFARHRLRSIERKRYHEEWILEGHFHVLFVLGLICERDEIELFDVSAATLRLNEAVALVGDFVDRHSNVAAYRLFRAVDTTEQLAKAVEKTKKSEIGLPQLDLFSDPVVHFTA
jgi:hypothetical protein